MWKYPVSEEARKPWYIDKCNSLYAGKFDEMDSERPFLLTYNTYYKTYDSICASTYVCANNNYLNIKTITLQKFHQNASE